MSEGFFYVNGFPVTFSEDILVASTLYREREEKIYKDESIEGSMRSLIGSDPDLLAQFEAGWGQIASEITRHFSEMSNFWIKKRKPDKAPKEYDFHLTVSVAREAFQTAVVKSSRSETGVDVQQATDFTLRRLGIVGEFDVFLRDEGFLHETMVEGPQP